jgi:3-hydroxybutyryl-CoA dehydratase
MNQLNGYDVEDLRVGMSASFSKTITEADLVLFAGVSGDNNAMHVNEEFAAATSFGGRIAHGMLTASVISAAIANKMPGPGTKGGHRTARALEPENRAITERMK